MNEGITDSCAGVCLCYLRQRIDHIAKYTDIGKMEDSKRNTVSNTRTQHINKEFTLFSKATSSVQLSVVAFFYCVFKTKICNVELNLSLLKQRMLSRVVLGFPKPLECTDSFLTKSQPLQYLMG